MSRYSLSHVEDHLMFPGLAAAVTNERGCTAEALSWIAEFDARKLYRPAAHPTMYAFLVGELNLSEDAALKRIRAARTAYEYPTIFEMVSDGRLHLSAVVMLAAHLTPTNASELLTSASGKSKAQIELLLAERFPKPDVETQVEPGPGTPAPPAAPLLAANPSSAANSQSGVVSGATEAAAHSLAPGPVVPCADEKVVTPVEPLPSRARLTPLAPERFALQVTLVKATHDKLRQAQALLSHALPSGDVAEVLDRALDALIEKLEKRRYATTNRPSARRRSKSARHIPAHVRREVSDRDRYQCTFVSASGKCCAERRFLEYDHVHPVARGGQATVENTRLRCRAHNQYEAERMYGAGFMREKRHAAKAATQLSRVRNKGADPVSSVRERDGDPAAGA